MLRVASLLLLVACADPVRLPSPPNLDSLAHSYEHPSAELSDAAVQEALSTYEDELVMLEQLGGMAGVLGSVESLDESVDKAPQGSSITLNRLPLESDAQILLRGDCGNAPGELGYGTFQLQMVVQASELLPVAWGSVQDCHVVRSLRGEELTVTFGGEVTLQFLGAERIGKALLRDALVRLELTQLSVAGVEAPLRGAHFRLQEGLLSFLVNLEEHGTVLASTTEDPAFVRLEGMDQVLLCARETRRCGPEQP